MRQNWSPRPLHLRHYQPPPNPLHPVESGPPVRLVPHALRERAEANGRQRLAITLARVYVGAARSTLCLHSQPLKPLSRIAPNPTTSLTNPDDRKAKIDAQVAVNVPNRHFSTTTGYTTTPTPPVRCDTLTPPWTSRWVSCCSFFGMASFAVNKPIAQPTAPKFQLS